MSKSDVSQYVRPTSLPEGGSAVNQIRTARLKGKFYPPTPEWWMNAALKIAKQRRNVTAVHVGLVLWQQLRMKKSQPLRISKTVWVEYGLERRAVSRALGILESVGLIRVKRFKHRSPEIVVVTDKPKSNGKLAEERP